MNRIIDIADLLNDLGICYEIQGDTNSSFETFCPLNSLKPKAITWVRNTNDIDVDLLNNTEGIILFAEIGSKIENAKFPIIYAENVHRSFFRVIQAFFKYQNPDLRKPGIASSAIIEAEQYGKDLYVGHHTYIGPDVEIGDFVTILNNVTIQGRVTIGDHTIIESGTTIGACGFGHYWDEDGNPVVVAHLGGVKIGHHVKIGANNAISRGCLADTIIEDYVQTDNLCHIAHNDIIKKGAMLTANTVISGSTVVGENAWLAPGSLLNNGIIVGKDAFLGLGAVATKNVPENNVVVGMPAKTLRNRYNKETES